MTTGFAFRHENPVKNLLTKVDFSKGKMSAFVKMDKFSIPVISPVSKLKY